MDLPRIVIIGAGNVATHLARALDRVSSVVQIISAHHQNAVCLAAQLCNCEAASPATIYTEADFYIVAVNDDNISTVTAEMPRVNGIVAHTSGSTPMQAISADCRGKGVFYPLQTFSKDAELDISAVPFFIEGSDTETTEKLCSLAGLISNNIFLADSDQRATLHIAAVFASNFFNHLLVESGKILAADGYPLDVMLPLLKVTLDKAMSMGPDKAQTGPASRGDTNVIDTHLSRLSGLPREIYRLMSDAIMSQNKS